MGDDGGVVGAVTGLIDHCDAVAESRLARLRLVTGLVGLQHEASFALTALVLPNPVLVVLDAVGHLSGPEEI